MTAPRHANDAVAPGECWRKIVEHVRRVPSTSQEEQGPTGAAPIEHFQPYLGIDLHEPHGVGRGISPLLLLRRRGPSRRHEKPRRNEADGDEIYTVKHFNCIVVQMFTLSSWRTCGEDQQRVKRARLTDETRPSTHAYWQLAETILT